MKKRILFCISGIVIGIILWKGYQTLPLFQPPQENQQTVLGEQSIPRVTLVLTNNEHIATYSNVLAMNAFEALKSVADEQQIVLKTKQYDFGIFVERIGNFSSSNESAWLYFVNGISGETAADKKILKTGDTVEWRYMKPTL
jgi:hypothetical protein